MADDLGDEWWLSGQNAGTIADIQSDSDGAEGEPTKKKSKKRKLSVEGSDTVKNKKKREDNESTDAKKPKKKKKGDAASKDDTDISVEKKTEKKKREKLKNGKEKSGKENADASEQQKVSENLDKKQKKLKTDSKNNQKAASDVTSVDVGTEGNKKKKNKRRRLTEMLAKKPDMPLVPNDLISSVSKFYTGQLSLVEMDELQLDDKHFTVCNDLTHTPQSYIKSLMPKWKKLIADSSNILQGAPLVLVVCASGIRTVELIRSLADFKVKDFYIAKLFSKHLKIENQVKFLKTHRTHIGVGTPKRIEELILNGSLSLEQTKYVVFDWSWRDAKMSRMMDKTQLREHVMSLLKTCIIPRVRVDSIKLGLF